MNVYQSQTDWPSWCDHTLEYTLHAFPHGKIAPALAAGCTIVHKPAELSPLTASILMEIAKNAGLPDGVWNSVNGFGEDVGKALTEHPDIKAIAFCRRKLDWVSDPETRWQIP